MSSERIQVHSARIPVRWGDMDAYAHVSNTVYFRYFEQARIEWLENAGYLLRTDQPTGPVVINAGCTFLLPVTYPASLRIDVFAGDPGRSSVMTWYELRVEGDDRVYAEGYAKVVWTDRSTGKSTELPQGLRQGLEDCGGEPLPQAGR